MAMPAKIIVDFTKTKDRSGINPVRQKPGDYRGVIKSVDHAISQNENKTPQLVYIIADSDRPSATYRYNCPLTEASAWKIRNLLIASGVEVPKKRINIASIAAKIVGREVGMSLDDDEYEGRVRSQIVNVFPATDLPDDESGSVDPEDDADEDEDEDDDTEEEVQPTKKVATKKAGAPAKTSTKKATKAKPVEDPEDEDEDEDEDLEELDVDEL